MSDRREDDLSAIAWPGFVDILSAVIIMFVFFLMIVATALFFHIIIYISKLEPTTIEVPAQGQDMEFAQMQTEFAESKEQSVQFSQDTKDLTVFFNDDAISLLPDTKDQLGQELDKYIQQGGPDGYHVQIIASRPLDSLEVAGRKIAVARLLNVRNTLIKAGFSTSTIFPKVVNGEPIDGSSHWVRIELIEK